MDIYNFQHSEIRLTPNQITFRSDTEEWTTLQNITAVYFTSVRTERFTLSDMAKDFAMGVQRDGEEDVIINIQGMYLRCYIAAIVQWSKKFYTVVKAPKQSEEVRLVPMLQRLPRPQIQMLHQMTNQPNRHRQHSPVTVE